MSEYTNTFTERIPPFKATLSFVFVFSDLKHQTFFFPPQVPRTAIEGPVPPAASVHPAERRAHLQDQRDVHQRHQAVPLRGPVQERRLLRAWGLRALAFHFPHAALSLQDTPQDANRGNVLTIIYCAIKNFVVAFWTVKIENGNANDSACSFDRCSYYCFQTLTAENVCNIGLFPEFVFHILGT